MIERTCRVAGCAEGLSDRLPPEFLVCGHHQLKGLAILCQYPELKKTPANISFFALHCEGCFASNLAEFCDVPVETICFSIRRGRVEARKVSEVEGLKGMAGCYWWIALPEMVRVIDLCQNWVRVSDACKGKVAPSTYLSFARQGHLGEVRQTMGKRLAIRRSVLPQLDQIFATKKRSGNRKCHPMILEKGEVSVAEAMGLVPIDIRYMVSQKKMPGKKRGKRWVTTWKDLLVVAEQVVQSKLKVRDRKVVLRTQSNISMIRRNAEQKPP